MGTGALGEQQVGDGPGQGFQRRRASSWVTAPGIGDVGSFCHGHSLLPAPESVREGVGDADRIHGVSHLGAWCQSLRVSLRRTCAVMCSDREGAVCALGEAMRLC